MSYYRQMKWAERSLFQAKEYLGVASKHLDLAARCVDSPKDFEFHNTRANSLMQEASELAKQIGAHLGREK